MRDIHTYSPSGVETIYGTDPVIYHEIDNVARNRCGATVSVDDTGGAGVVRCGGVVPRGGTVVGDRGASGGGGWLAVTVTAMAGSRVYVRGVDTLHTVEGASDVFVIRFGVFVA